MRFHEDPNDPTQMICDDCFRAVEEVNSEWMDDVMEEEFNLEFEDEEYEDEDDDE